MSLIISEAQSIIAEKYVGFRPNTNRVKPVHIANGLFRTTVGYNSRTSDLMKFILPSTKKGKVPPGHKLEEVYDSLERDNKIISDEITPEDISKLRVLANKVVTADDAVFEGSMASYTAGSAGFLTSDSIAQDGGELISEWLKKFSPMLHECIKKSLIQNDDAISLLFSPILSDEKSTRETRFDLQNQDLFMNKVDSLPSEIRNLLNGLGTAGNTLAKHLDLHPNKLVRMRLAILFASFILVRHMASLELYYTSPQNPRILPFLLDFSEVGNTLSPVSRASQMSYTLICQSLGRFYSWAFGEGLKETHTVDLLLTEPTPKYNERSTKHAKDLDEIWNFAKAESVNSEEPYITFGEALYHMQMIDSSVNPIQYLRALGIASGLFWPPVNTQPTKRFVLQQDMLETLIRGAVDPGEVVDLTTLQDRLWDRYGIVVGGRPVDEERLIRSGIYQADTNALTENKHKFIAQLGTINFARLLADGVLKIDLGGYHD